MSLDEKNVTNRQTPDRHQTDRQVKIGLEHAPSNIDIILPGSSDVEWDNHTIRGRDSRAFPRDVPRAKPEGHPEEKPDCPDL